MRTPTERYKVRGKVGIDCGLSDLRSCDLNDHLMVSCSLKFFEVSILLNSYNSVPFYRREN